MANSQATTFLHIAREFKRLSVNAVPTSGELERGKRVPLRCVIGQVFRKLKRRRLFLEAISVADEKASS
jgi:hypothetical protein